MYVTLDFNCRVIPRVKKDVKTICIPLNWFKSYNFFFLKIIKFGGNRKYCVKFCNDMCTWVFFFLQKVDIETFPYTYYLIRLLI